MEVADSGKIGSGIIEKYRPLASETDALSRSDRNNLCLLLCQTMEEFPLIVEARSRDVVPLFLTFLRFVVNYIVSPMSVNFLDAVNISRY